MIPHKRERGNNNIVKGNMSADVNNGVELLSLAHEIHKTAKQKGWWDNPRNDAEAIALCHSELFEGNLALVSDSMDDKIPEFKGYLAEQADVLIRLLDWVEGKHILIGADADIGFGVFDYNDHKQIELAYQEISSMYGQGTDPVFRSKGLFGIHEDQVLCSNHAGMLVLHDALASITEALRSDVPEVVSAVAFRAIQLCATPTSEILPVVRAKTNFNKTRERMHGGKKF